MELQSAITSALHELETGYPTLSHHRDTLRTGLLALLGQIPPPSPYNPAWDDAVEYCHAVIMSPDDSSNRANAAWSRSYSDVCKHLLSLFDDTIIAAAHKGALRIRQHYSPNTLLDIAHVDKKQNFLANFTKEQPALIFQQPKPQPQDQSQGHEPSVLATACYELTTLCCAITQSAWLPTPLAVQSSFIANASVCDDYYQFTYPEARVRVYMVALSLGAVYSLGGQAVNMLVDATSLQATGQRPPGAVSTIETALAWRAVGGCSTGFSSYLWAGSSLEEGLVGPEVMMAMHDLLDWRCDAAAGNHENGLFAVYGLGEEEEDEEEEEEDPFHAYLEAMLRRANNHAVSGAHAIAGIVCMHWTSSRYGAYRYYSEGAKREWTPCDGCVRLTRRLTAGAKLSWDPQPPPSGFAGGAEFRETARWVVDQPMDTDLTGLAQQGLSWFQHLIASGRIRLFDALVELDALDSLADWV